MKAAARCGAKPCGAAFDACIGPATPAAATVDPRLKKWQVPCTRARACGAVADEASCMEEGKSSPRSAISRAVLRCATKACGDYAACFYGALKVPAARLACVPICAHELQCKAAGKAAPPLEVADCARACSLDAAGAAAVGRCVQAGCGTAYDVCMAAMRKRIAPPEAPATVRLSPAEQRCKASCARAVACGSLPDAAACEKRCLQRDASREFGARHRCAQVACGGYDACLVGKLGVSGKRLACVPACRHELRCRPPGAARGLEALAACARKCTLSQKEIAAVVTCAPEGCGAPYNRCVLKTSGKQVELDASRKRCEALCVKAGECTRGAGGDGCVARCVAGGDGAREFKVREGCQSEACPRYETCLLTGMGVPAKARRCLDACRWDLQCARDPKPGDLVALAGCLKSCQYTDRELEARSDCEAEGCGSRFDACVKRRLAAPAPPAPPPKP